MKESLEVVSSICVYNTGKKGNMESETYSSILVKRVQNVSKVTNIGTGSKQDLDTWEL